MSLNLPKSELMESNKFDNEYIAINDNENPNELEEKI